MQQPAVKRVRTCIGCGSAQGKDALYRIVRTPDGAVSFDATGRLAGRGAYVCGVGCLEKALRGRKLQRALKCGVTQEEAERILEEFRVRASDTSNDRR